MAKTIQVRVDDALKESADNLFASLGLDTSTAVRMFLVQATEARGFPFPVVRSSENDTLITDAIARRKAGAQYYTSDEFLAGVRNSIDRAGGHVTA